MGDQKPKLTIGLAIYNGEKFVRDKLENILSQTFSNFEIIISDNASTDKTQEICNEFLKNDKRIQYFRQKTNIGGIQNFIFVISKAKTEYFVVTSADDKWDKNFLSKNIQVLEENNSIVGSIGKIEFFPTKFDVYKSQPEDIMFKKYYNRLRSYFTHHGSDSITGKTFEERASRYLQLLKTQNPSYDMYAVFRTDALQKSMIPNKDDKLFLECFWNSATINILEYGNIHLIDEVLIHYNTRGGGFGVTPLTEFKQKKSKFIQLVFPWSTQISWFIHKFGLKFFFKYFFDFLLLFLMGELIFIQSIYKELKK